MLFKRTPSKLYSFTKLYLRKKYNDGVVDKVVI